MSLLSETLESLEDEPNDLPYIGNSVYHDILDERRWYNKVITVFQRDDEFVAVEYHEGATELQEDTELEAKAYSVEPYEKTVTAYRKVEA